MLSSIDEFLEKECEIIPEGQTLTTLYRDKKPQSEPYPGFIEVEETSTRLTAKNPLTYQTPVLTAYSRYLVTTPQSIAIRDATSFADAIAMHPRIFLWSKKEGHLTNAPVGTHHYKLISFIGLRLKLPAVSTFHRLL